MLRKILIAGAGAVLLGCFPAYGQEDTDVPELDGAPGSRDVPKPLVVPKPVPKTVAPRTVTPKTTPQVAQKPSQGATDKLKADEARLAKLAETQRAEQQRLAQAAADLKAREASLEARAAALAEEERRLGQLRDEQEAELAAQKADLASRQAALDADRSRVLAQRDQPVAPETDDAANARRPVRASFDLDAARRSCARAGEEEALDQRFYSARYDGAPRLLDEGQYEDGWALRGLMRLETRRGYTLIDTICQVDADGEVARFAFLR